MYFKTSRIDTCEREIYGYSILINRPVIVKSFLILRYCSISCISIGTTALADSDYVSYPVFRAFSFQTKGSMHTSQISYGFAISSFELHLRARYFMCATSFVCPLTHFRYRPGFWQLIKVAWIQYLTILFIFLYVFGRIRRMVFENQVVLTVPQKVSLVQTHQS